MIIKIIGDVHGKYDEYINKVKNEQFSVCLGDVGFNYSSLKVLDPLNHRIIAGNHDNYDNLSQHFLGDYGIVHNMFFIRGAWSIDWQLRTPGFDWFEKEEISYQEMKECLELYNLIQPEIVLSHDCPKYIKQIYFNIHDSTDRTSAFLDLVLKHHRPKLWIFGHWHRDVDFLYTHKQSGEKTHFKCLDELSTCNIEYRICDICGKDRFYCDSTCIECNVHN